VSEVPFFFFTFGLTILSSPLQLFYLYHLLKHFYGIRSGVISADTPHLFVRSRPGNMTGIGFWNEEFTIERGNRSLQDSYLSTRLVGSVDHIGNLKLFAVPKIRFQNFLPSDVQLPTSRPVTTLAHGLFVLATVITPPRNSRRDKSYDVRSSFRSPDHWSARSPLVLSHSVNRYSVLRTEITHIVDPRST
jgi:hypothetical protein